MPASTACSTSPSRPSTACPCTSMSRMDDSRRRACAATCTRWLICPVATRPRGKPRYASLRFPVLSQDSPPRLSTSDCSSPLSVAAIRSEISRMKTIAGKRALVTGAASGIGRAIAWALARQGVDLFLLDLNEAALDELADSLRGQGACVIARRCDLRVQHELDARLAELLSEWGGVDIVVNNAGITYVAATAEMSDAQW